MVNPVTRPLHTNAAAVLHYVRTLYTPEDTWSLRVREGNVALGLLQQEQIRALKALERAGHIECARRGVRGPGKATTYRLAVAA